MPPLQVTTRYLTDIYNALHPVSWIQLLPDNLQCRLSVKPPPFIVRKGQAQPPPIVMPVGQQSPPPPAEVNAPASLEKEISTLQVRVLVVAQWLKCIPPYFVSIEPLPTNDQVEVAHKRAENHRLAEYNKRLMKEKKQHMKPVLETPSDPPSSTMRGRVAGVLSPVPKKEMTGIAFPCFLVDWLIDCFTIVTWHILVTRLG